LESPEYDAVVVGAGILGLATAYHIKKRCRESKILIIDKMNGAGMGNTAKSAGMFRSFFYSKTNLYLADSSIEFYRHIEENGHDLGMRWIGYLWLFSNETYNKLKKWIEEMGERGYEFKIYDRDYLKKTLNVKVEIESELKELMELDPIDVGVYAPKAGKIDVDKLVKFYETEFLKMKGKVLYGAEVVSIVVEPKRSLGLPGEPYFWQESRVTGVQLSNGKIIKAKKTIIAAGVWSPKLLDPIGIDAHCKPKKRQIFVIKADSSKLKQLLNTKGFNKYGCLPFTILPKPRIYIRPDIDEQTFWVGYADDFNRSFKLEEEPQPEENFYRYGIYPILSAYFPQFTSAHPFNSWAGQYAINTLDHQPVVLSINDLIYVGAASGSGIMKADSLGRIAAAAYFEEEEAELFTGKLFRIRDLSIENRNVEKEKFVI